MLEKQRPNGCQCSFVHHGKYLVHPRMNDLEYVTVYCDSCHGYDSHYAKTIEEAKGRCHLSDQFGALWELQYCEMHMRRK